MAKITIKLDIRPLEKFRRQFDKQMNSRNFSSTLGSMWDLIGVLYLSFTRRRFVNFSKGGGNWAPLKSKRKRGSTKKARILIDTGIMFGALSIGASGNLHKKIPFGVQVGFSEGTRHGKNNFTIRDLAVAHDLGKGKTVKREILVEPDAMTIQRMHSVIKRKIARFGKECEK